MATVFHGQIDSSDFKRSSLRDLQIQHLEGTLVLERNTASQLMLSSALLIFWKPALVRFDSTSKLSHMFKAPATQRPAAVFPLCFPCFLCFVCPEGVYMLTDMVRYDGERILRGAMLSSFCEGLLDLVVRICGNYVVFA